MAVTVHWKWQSVVLCMCKGGSKDGREAYCYVAYCSAGCLFLLLEYFEMGELATRGGEVFPSSFPTFPVSAVVSYYTLKASCAIPPFTNLAS